MRAIIILSLAVILLGCGIVQEDDSFRTRGYCSLIASLSGISGDKTRGVQWAALEHRKWSPKEHVHVVLDAYLPDDMEYYFESSVHGGGLPEDPCEDIPELMVDGREIIIVYFTNQERTEAHAEYINNPMQCYRKDIYERYVMWRVDDDGVMVY